MAARSLGLNIPTTFHSWVNLNKQDQGSKAPSSHTSFYLCLSFYQVYLRSILSFAPCTFLPSWPYIIEYHKQSTNWTYHSLHLPFYPVYLSTKFTYWTYHSLHLEQNITIVKKFVYLSTKFTYLSYHSLHVHFYPVYLSNLSFSPFISNLYFFTSLPT